MPQDLPTRTTIRDQLLTGLLVVSICAVGAVGWAAWRVGTLADSVKVPDLSATVAKANGTLDAVNSPCATDAEKAAHRDHPCGTLANLNKLVVKIGDLAVTSQRQVAQTDQLVTATARNLDSVGSSVRDVATKLSGTATAATDALQQARTDLVTADGTIAAAKPVLVNLAATESDLDAAVVKNREGVASLIANGVTISGEVAGMSTDLHHYTHPILNPDPCKTKKCVAGRVAGRIESLLGVADTLHGAETLFTPLKVKVGK